ncbi:MULTISPECIES: hypothetical protein [Amycolatopsis]|uniref:hypothetical protein n=1 Tax=Amycolatopsis TaxID=1813 RepID=UPI001177F2AC|nr:MULTISPECIES: hypothetical protein [Amycolatopsis]
MRPGVRRFAVVVVWPVLLAAGCGVTTQDEPEPIPSTTTAVPTTPQVTQRPDPAVTTGPSSPTSL